MKRLLPVLSLLIIISCSKEIQLDQLVERNGLSYEVNNEKPFTGSTLSYYSNDQLESRIEYKDGLKDGLSETFNKNGQIIKINLNLNKFIDMFLMWLIYSVFKTFVSNPIYFSK